MPAKKAQKAGGATSSSSRSSSKKQSKSSTSKSDSGAKKRSSTKRRPSGVGATVKRAGQAVAEVFTGAVDTVAKATGLKSKKK